MNQMQSQKNFTCFSMMSQETPMPFLTDQVKSKIQTENKLEAEIFQKLLSKFLNHQQITDAQLQQLPEQKRDQLQLIMQKVKSKVKRPDQCHKLFYKRAFKYSQKKYFKNKKNKKRMMSQFYHHHFDQIATKNGNPITAFYHPNKKTKPGLSLGQKTFNLSYVRLLLKSSSFRMDARQYHKIFVSQCLKERAKKMKSFMQSLQKIMKRDINNLELIKYLQGSQCKIPWTLEEVYKAAGLAEKQLVKYDQFTTLGSQVDPEKQQKEDNQMQEQYEDCSQRQSFFDYNLELPEMF